MADMKIEEAPLDTSVSGQELIPESDGGVSKSVSVSMIRDFVAAAISDSEEVSSTDLSLDGFYIRQGESMRRLKGTSVAQAILGWAFGLAPIVSPNGNEIFVIDDSGTKKTITLEALQNYISANAESIFGGLGPEIPVGGSDTLMVKQGGSVNSVKLSSVAEFVHEAFASFIQNEVNVLNVQNSDRILVLSGGVQKTMTVGQLLSAVGGGDVSGPASTTEGNVPVWGSQQKSLENGMSVTNEVNENSTTSQIPSAAAVNAAIKRSASGAGSVQGPSVTTPGNIPRWDTTSRTLKDGVGIVEVVSQIGTDTNVPTEKAVRSAISAERVSVDTALGLKADKAELNSLSVEVESKADKSDISGFNLALGRKASKDELDEVKRSVDGKVSSSGTKTSGKLVAWNSAGAAVDGKSVVESVGAYGSNDSVPTEKAVRDAIEAQGAGFVKSSGTKTPGKLVAWNSAGAAADGKTVVESVGSTGSNDSVPTEKAVRDAIKASGGVTPPTSHVEGYVPLWDSGAKLKAGMRVTTSLAAESSASNDVLPTEKAVRDAIGKGSVTPPASHSKDFIPQWDAGNSLTGGVKITQTIDASGTAKSNEIPSAAAVREAIPGLADSSTDGLMSSADKRKLDGLADTGAVSEIGADLDDSDTVVVRDNDTTFRKALLSRFWRYVLSKLPTVRIDQLAAPADIEAGNASTTAHGFLRKLPGGTDKFLRGDGSFAVPPGTTEFSGDEGTGGSSGLVPAPGPGDGSAHKFLCADGRWSVAPSAAGVDIPGSPDIGTPTGSDAVYAYKASAGTYARMTLGALSSFLDGIVRMDYMFIPAGAFAPSTVDGCAMSSMRFTSNTHDVATYVGTGNTSAEFNVAMPDDWDGGPVKAKVLWTCGSAIAEAGQTVSFGVGAVGLDDGDPASDPPAGTVPVSDTLIAVNEVHKSPASGEIVPSGNAAPGGMLHFVLSRDVSAGTIVENVNVFGVVIQFGRKLNSGAW